MRKLKASAFERLKKFALPLSDAPQTPGMWGNRTYPASVPENVSVSLKAIKVWADDLYDAIQNGDVRMAQYHLDDIRRSLQHSEEAIEHLKAMGGTEGVEPPVESVSGD